MRDRMKPSVRLSSRPEAGPLVAIALAALALGCVTSTACAQSVLINPPAGTPLAAPPAVAPRAPGTSTLTELAAEFDKTPDRVVTTVDGLPVTLGMVADRLRDFAPNLGVLPASILYRAALDDLVMQRAGTVKARALGIDKDPAVRRRIEEATDHELTAALVRRIVPEMVTDKAIQDRYNATIAGHPGEDEVQFRVIATATEAEAQEAIAAIAHGADFADLARRLSKDPSSLNGGEIGYARRDLLRPEVSAVVYSLAPGQTNAYPVPSSGLWFVFQVEGRRQSATPSLADVKDRLVAELTHEATLEILRKTRASVEVKDFGMTGASGEAAQGTPKSH